MPYFPPKETRRRMSLKEVDAIIRHYFGKWFEADVKYDTVDGYYFEWECPVCKGKLGCYLFDDERNKLKTNGWHTCPRCDSRIDYDFHWYKEDKARYKLNLDGTTLNVEVSELEAMYKDQE